MKLFTFVKKSPKGKIESIKNYGSIKALMENETLIQNGKELTYENLCYRFNKYRVIDSDEFIVEKNQLIKKKRL